jgi:hypothetical protein
MEAMVQEEKVHKPKPSLFGMIWAPVQQFEKMRENAPIWGPLLILAVLNAVLGGIAAYFAAGSPQLQEARDILGEGGKGLKMFAVGGAVAAGLFGTPIGLAITALFYKVCMMILSNDTPYRKLFSILIFAGIITALGSLINTLLLAALGGEIASYTNFSSLFETGSLGFAIAGAFDVFAIWRLILVGIGLYIAAGLSKNKTIGLLVVIFVLGLLFAGGSAFLPTPPMP